MRGLGYTQTEIGEHLGVSQATIQYQISKINRRAREEGGDKVWLDLTLSNWYSVFNSLASEVQRSASDSTTD